MKLTPEELQDIRDRAEAATPGPWEVAADLPDAWWLESVVRDADGTAVAYTRANARDGVAELIAHAPTDIPAMLAHIAALEAENARMRVVVETVAEAGVGDEYGGGSWLMFAGYDAETVRQQARAILAAHPPQEAPPTP